MYPLITCMLCGYITQHCTECHNCVPMVFFQLQRVCEPPSSLPAVKHCMEVTSTRQTLCCRVWSERSTFTLGKYEASVRVKQRLGLLHVSFMSFLAAAQGLFSKTMLVCRSVLRRMNTMRYIPTAIETTNAYVWASGNQGEVASFTGSSRVGCVSMLS